MSQRALDQLYEQIAAAGLQPLWIDSGSYIPRQPSPRVAPAHWKAEKLLRLLRDAGDAIPNELADRRVLVCKNPALPPFAGTTQTLYACVQLLRPGESAVAHRHSQSAFRFILSGEGAYTVLNGQRIYMKPGDFIATPHWTWHGHGNESGNDMIWLDGVDNAILQLFDATFFQLTRSGEEDEGSADTKGARENDSEPHWYYSSDAMYSLLAGLRRDGALDLSHGYRVRYIDPRSGRDPLPTMSAFLGHLPAGFEGEWYRSSDSTVFVVSRGSGVTELDGQTIEWSENDIFMVPTWMRYRHIAAGDAVLFSFSDRNAQERLECWREQRNVV